MIIKNKKAEPMSKNYLKMLIVAGVLVLGLGVVLGVLQWKVHGNINYAEKDLALYCVHKDQCELPGDGKLITEVQNTFSNLAYLFFGVCVLVRAGREGLPLNERPAMLLFGLSLCFLALCSGYYHATLNFAGTHTLDDGGGEQRAHIVENKVECKDPQRVYDHPQVLDIVGVYATLISLFLYAVESAFRQRSPAADRTTVLAALFGFGLPGAAARPQRYAAAATEVRRELSG